TRHVRVSRAPAKLGIALAGLSFSTFFWFADAAHAAGVVEAARDGDLATVRELIGAGADANAAANDGSTPLLWAAYHSDVEMAQALLAAGADPDVANDFGVN